MVLHKIWPLAQLLNLYKQKTISVFVCLSCCHCFVNSLSLLLLLSLSLNAYLNLKKQASQSPMLMKGEAVSAQLWIQYGEQNEINSSTPPTHMYSHISKSVHERVYAGLP